MSWPDWKPVARRKDAPLLRLLKVGVSECELCGATGNLHLHHVRYRSHGGDDVKANIVVLDRDCHDLYHSGDTAVRSALGHHLLARRPDTMRYLRMKLGQEAADDWVARHL